MHRPASSRIAIRIHEQRSIAAAPSCRSACPAYNPPGKRERASLTVRRVGISLTSGNTSQSAPHEGHSRRRAWRTSSLASTFRLKYIEGSSQMLHTCFAAERTYTECPKRSVVARTDRQFWAGWLRGCRRCRFAPTACDGIVCGALPSRRRWAEHFHAPRLRRRPRRQTCRRLGARP